MEHVLTQDTIIRSIWNGLLFRTVIGFDKHFAPTSFHEHSYRRQL